MYKEGSLDGAKSHSSSLLEVTFLSQLRSLILQQFLDLDIIHGGRVGGRGADSGFFLEGGASRFASTPIRIPLSYIKTPHGRGVCARPLCAALYRCFCNGIRNLYLTVIARNSKADNLSKFKLKNKYNIHSQFT